VLAGYAKGHPETDAPFLTGIYLYHVSIPGHMFNGAVFLMLLFNIFAEQFHVIPDHVQGAVPQYLLQGEDVAAI